MILKNRQELKHAAAVTLHQATGDPKKLTLIYSGATLGISFVVLVLTYFSDHVLANYGGLSAMATQAAASSFLGMLNITVALLTPIWSAGFLMCALKWVRREEASPKDLLSGFSRLLPLVRLYLVKAVMTFAVTFIAMYAAAMLFMMTPLSNAMNDLLMPYLTEEVMADPTLVLQYVDVNEFLRTLIPFIPLALAAFAGVYYIFMYRLRFAEYFILDGHTDRARVALALSTRMLHFRKKDLLKLDLSFWWYYAATVLLTAVCYLDVILGFLGVTLPFDPAITYFVPVVLYMVGTLILDVSALPYIQTVYTEAYYQLSNPNEPEADIVEAE